MKNFLGVVICASVVSIFQLSQVLSTPYYYTGTNVWNVGNGQHHAENQGVVVAASPALFFAKTRSDVGTQDTANKNSSLCKESNGQFADPKYCDKYYDCWEGRPVSSGQCSHGLMFNEQTASCDYPSMVNCDGKEVNQPFDDLDKGCEQPYGKFADSRDCRKYTVCHAGIATYYTCEEGLAYDKDNGLCAAPLEPSCLQGPPNDIPEGQDVPEVPLNPDEIKPFPPSGPSGGDGDGGSFPIFPDWPKGTKCPTSSGFLPVVKDCTSVLVCIDGSGYLLTCPSGTYYDPAKARCTPGTANSCEQMHFSNVKTSGGGSKFAYFSSRYPLLPPKHY